ncbi:MAG: hypothetical protein ACYTGO_02745 [Planctomycetota bacterium]|jgi:hypothetical protein
MKLQTLAVLLLASLALGQNQTTKTIAVLPTPAVTGGNKLPFSAQSGRYAQWYAAPWFTPTIKHPARIRGIEFMADSGTHIGTATLNLQVAMANSDFLSGSFPTSQQLETVFPRNNVTLGRMVPGTWTLTINFTKDFVWDGRSGIVVDVRQWSNGSTSSLNYNFRSTALATNLLQRVWANTNPNAITGDWKNGIGLYTRFLYQEGGSYPLGQGCAGANSIVPVSTTNRVPLPGDPQWTHLLTKTSGRKPAYFVVGLSQTQWNTLTLPLDMSPFGWLGCSLYTEPSVLIGLTTVGGGPGTGSAALVTPIPAIGSLGGFQFYTQWLVFDAAAANRVVSFSNALWHVVGS